MEDYALDYWMQYPPVNPLMNVFIGCLFALLWSISTFFNLVVLYLLAK